MTAVLAYAAVILILAASVFCARSLLPAGVICGAVTRARWVWACRKPPARSEGKLNRADYLTFIGLVETWRQPAYGEEPERTRT